MCFFFSGALTVHVKSREAISMDQLHIGDLVQVSKDTYEPVYSFCHRSVIQTSLMSKLWSSPGSPVPEISLEHLIETNKNLGFVHASKLVKGMVLVDSARQDTTVTLVESIMWCTGAYAPFMPPDHQWCQHCVFLHCLFSW